MDLGLDDVKELLVLFSDVIMTRWLLLKRKRSWHFLGGPV